MTASDIVSEWKSEVDAAYRRAREKLNRKFAGNTVCASYGKWGRNSDNRTAEEEIEVYTVEIFDRGNRGERFIIALMTENGDTYFDPEEVTLA
jgi:hypothetical protein